MEILIFYVIIKQNIFYLIFMATFNPDQIDLFPQNQKPKTNDFWFSKKITSILDQVNCPNCWEDFVESLWCKNCWYWILSWELEVDFESDSNIDEYVKKELRRQKKAVSEIINISWETQIESWDLNKINRLITLDSKLNWNEVVYTKQHLILSPSWDKIYLKIWNTKYKIWIKYSIKEITDFTEENGNVLKIAQDLKITYIFKKHNSKTYKKSFLNTQNYKQLIDFILKEILNNAHLNYSII